METNLSLIISLISLLISIIILILFIINSKKTNNEEELKDIRECINESINTLGKTVSELIVEKNSSLVNEVNKNIETLTTTQKQLIEYNLMFNENASKSIKDLSETVANNLKEIREDNSKQLDKINESVNEKLQKTLEDQLQNSLKGVVSGLGEVNKAMGEIKGIASDVGSLKSVLTNVKTKGIMGEVILGNIIKDFLTVNQYDENVVTKKGSSERVEFAIKLPGSKDEIIYLPVDSKFPYEPYTIIQSSNNPEEIKNARDKLRSNLLKYAKDVSEKYIDVPNTTDFAIIFLPLEGLYLEALNLGLFEEIQSKYKVNLTGPSTFTAFISSLNMGFRSLMIQKKSAEVFKTLGAVKTEFSKFTEALEKTQTKVNQAANELDNLVGTRTRAINRTLKEVDMIDEETSKTLLNNK